MFEIIGAGILIIIAWSIGQSIGMMIFPKYGLKRAKIIYNKMPNSENLQRIEDFEWKVRRKYGSL
jgi:hypothetical protein